MKQKRIQKIAFFMAIVLSFLICGFLYVLPKDIFDKEDRFEGIYESEPVRETVFTKQEDLKDISLSASQTQAAMVVFICGSVVNPGVYECPQGTRIYEIIDKAGGVTEDACISAINPAEIIYDGQKIYVPSATDVDMGDFIPADPESGSARININKADASLLMTLPGIGQAKAEAIVAYRKENGDFSSVEDIMKVNGIKESAFNKIKDYICIR